MQTRPYWRNYIDGRWTDGAGGGRIAVENPGTGETIAEVACAGAADVDRAVAAARRVFDSRVLWEMRPAQRGELMMAVADRLMEAVDEVALVECLDNGKTIERGRAEAAMAARYLRYYGGAADKLEGRMIPLGEGYVDYTVPSPFGVSAQIVPWNGPLSIGARSIACALITGNTVVMKSPELSPLSLFLLAEACERAGVPPGAVNILCGYGTEAGAALAGHHDIDHIVFTGSVATGRSILKAAAERVVPSVMELGGKSAAIVFPDADLDQAAASIAKGIFTHAGQICSAASRVLAHQSIHNDLVERIIAQARALSVGPGIDGHDMGPLISGAQLEKVETFCRGAEEEGARGVTGGRRRGDLPGYFMAPTVYAGVTPEMRIAREEVFGPVLAVMRFSSFDEAIRIANGTDYGLAAGVFTRDLALAHRTADRLVAGQVYVNEWWAGGVETPFGGTRRSGFGREKGQEALLSYVQTKNVALRIS